MIEIKNQKETLRNIPLFSEFSIEQLREVTAISKTKKFLKIKSFFWKEIFIKVFTFYLKAELKFLKQPVDGKESVVHILTSLNVFADIPLFEGRNYPVSAQTLSESLVIFIPKEEFLEFN